jgi:putative pyruvate formate lyase activating enzyme
MSSINNNFQPFFHLCNLCPRTCAADRINGKTGYCKTDAELHISSICLHRGEEPALGGEKGICNVFFSHCNMQCVYCQNHQISRNITDTQQRYINLSRATDKIINILNQGVTAVGFISPSHQIPWMMRIVEELHKQRYFPVIVFNTNSYDNAASIRMLEGLVDIYLPDFKYAFDDLAVELSDAPGYRDIALKSIREMYRQKGSTLISGENSPAESGIIIRHLVLPGLTENSKEAFRIIAEEISVNLHISLMSQYNPTESVRFHPSLSRPVYESEYLEVKNYIEQLGFHKGWFQEWGSRHHYNPDFTKEHPFE